MLSIVILYLRGGSKVTIFVKKNYWQKNFGPLVKKVLSFNILNYYLQRIGTKLFHNVLNPAQVPL